MHLMYFTEQPMSTYPPAEGDRYGYTALLFPNKFSIRFQAAGSTTSGWLSTSTSRSADGTVSCSTSIITRRSACRPSATSLPPPSRPTTKRVKIVLLGNPLPVADNPVVWPRSWQ